MKLKPYIYTQKNGKRKKTTTKTIFQQYDIVYTYIKDKSKKYFGQKIHFSLGGGLREVGPGPLKNCFFNPSLTLDLTFRFIFSLSFVIIFMLEQVPLSQFTCLDLFFRYDGIDGCYLIETIRPLQIGRRKRSGRS